MNFKDMSHIYHLYSFYLEHIHMSFFVDPILMLMNIFNMNLCLVLDGMGMNIFGLMGCRLSLKGRDNRHYLICSIVNYRHSLCHSIEN